MTELQRLQSYFETDIESLMTTDQNDIDYLEQNHYGDFLIESYEGNYERYKLWRNHDENIAQGEATIEIEYCGKANGYVWETIFTI